MVWGCFLLVLFFICTVGEGSECTMYEAIPLWLLFFFLNLFRGQFPSSSLWVQSPSKSFIKMRP